MNATLNRANLVLCSRLQLQSLDAQLLERRIRLQENFQCIAICGGAGRRVWVAGHKGMVGSAITRVLEQRGEEVLKAGSLGSRFAQSNGRRSVAGAEQAGCNHLCGGQGRGHSRQRYLSADFIYDNLVIEANVIHSAHMAGVDRLVFLGSSCIYPKFAPQPIKEEFS